MFLATVSSLAFITSTVVGSFANASAQGVDIYCVMRNGGNDHESSWKAAYTALKNERSGLFKISPKQAATIIVQQVVGSPDRYQDCIQYLGELYPKNIKEPKNNNKEKINRNKGYIEDRYSY
ncbi:DUF6554 family protein [Prochlorococcus marinus]|uniref:DUF6554 family protein n=1 Tax=Prochlorococcus marinus TaxID=1219 RepID=UPI0022B3C22C|nr:DUF6554 family protein [Prochlorococcus marinus]